MYHHPNRSKKETRARDFTYYDTLSLSRKIVRRALRLRYVGASSSRVRLATPAGPSRNASPGCPFPPLPSPPPSPISLALFFPRRVSVPAPPTRPSLSSQSMASPSGLGLPAPVITGPQRTRSPRSTDLRPLTLSGNPVGLCSRRLAAATSAAPRRFPSPLRLDLRLLTQHSSAQARGSWLA